MDGSSVIEWLDEDGRPLLDERPEPPDPVELFHGARDWMTEHVDQARELTAANGARMGPSPDRTERRGSSEEVVTTVLIDPDLSLHLAAHRTFFDLPIANMKFETKTARRSQSWYIWNARLRLSNFIGRAAELRIGPSPSGNLTVVELVPRTRRPIATKSFVRAGLPAIADICLRLLNRFEPTPMQKEALDRVT